MFCQIRALAPLVVASLTAALAVPARGEVLDEITVTAQKREESIQDVGIAISAFTGAQLKALGIEKSIDVAAFVPGVSTSGALAGQNTQFTIRGVTQNDFNDIVESPNAVYLDEGYIAVAQGQTFALFDIDRVEILKGPQGTLFGRNATGGLVQYISRKPSKEKLEAFADVSYGSYDAKANANTIRFEGAVGGPISSMLGARIAGLYVQDDAYLKNLYRSDTANYFGAGTFAGNNSFAANSPGSGAGADLGGGETKAVRGTLEFDPLDILRLTLSGNYAKTTMPTGPYLSKPTIAIYNGGPPDPLVQGSTGELVNVLNMPGDETKRSICGNGSDCGSDQDNNGFPDNLDGVPGADLGRINNQFQLTAGGDFFGYKNPSGTKDFVFSGDFAFKDQGHTETKGMGLRVERDLNDRLLLTSITDYKNFDKLLFIDVDSAPVNQSANFAGVDAQTWTQELRLNSSADNYRWVSGLYYLHIDNRSTNGLKFPVNSVVPGPFDLSSVAHLKTNSYSIFGQGEYDFTDTLTLIVGARYIREEKDYVFSQNIFNTTDSSQVNGGPATLIGPVFVGNVPQAYTDSRGEGLWAGKIQLDWKPTDDWLVYAGINRGVKAGSYNAQLAGGLAVPVSAIPYGSETLYSYETGFKSTWMDGRTRFNGSVFYYDYKDYQAFLFTGVSGVVVNADDNTVGAELEVQSSPIDGLDLLLSGSWFDATVKDVPLRVGGPISKDVDPTYAPKVQAAGLARYKWPFFQGSAFAQGDFHYSDSYYYNLRNFDADQFDSYTMVNARLGWTTKDEALTLALDIRNLNDARAGVQGFDLATLCGCNEVSYSPPRQYVLSAKYSF